MMSSSSPSRYILRGLQELLAIGGNSLVSSSRLLASQCEGETQLLASLLDSFERDICSVPDVTARNGLEDWIRTVLLSRGADSTILEHDIAMQENESKALAYLLLPYRVLEILESASRSDGGFSASSHSLPKTLVTKPPSKIYNTSLFDWPEVLRTALKQLKKLASTGGLQDFRVAAGGLTASLDRLSKLRTNSHAMAIMQNVQTTCVHLIFMLRGSTNGLCDKSSIAIPRLPGTVDDLVCEMERITGVASDRGSINRIVELMDKPESLQIQLLTAVLISPVFLFQSRNMSNDAWGKRSLLQTAFRLGNQKPLILIQIERIIWRMLIRLALSSAPLLTEIINMLESLPWESLERSVMALEARRWFECAVSPRPASKSQATQGVEVVDGIFHHTVVVPGQSTNALASGSQVGEKRSSTAASHHPSNPNAKRQRATTPPANSTQHDGPSEHDRTCQYHLTEDDNFTFPSETQLNPSAIRCTQGPTLEPSRSRYDVQATMPQADEVGGLGTGRTIERADSVSLIDTANDPIDIDNLYACTHAAPTGGYPVQESFETVTGYYMDGYPSVFYVKYQRKEDLKLLLDVEKQVRKGWILEKDPLYAVDYTNGTPPHTVSMFLDWVAVVVRDDMYSGGSQSLQRWRVLYFHQPSPKEKYQSPGGFRETIEGRVLGGYVNQIVLDDQCASYDPNDTERIRIGSVDLLCAEVSLPWRNRSKIYAAPPVPSTECDAFDPLYCTDTVAYKATHADSVRFRSWTSPAQALSYRTVLMQGAFEDWQMGPSGLGVVLTVELGELYVAVSDPGDGTLFTTELATMMSSARHGALPFRTRLESIALRSGNRIVIPPCALYLVHAIEDSICHKRYFYSTVHMPLTHLALAHSLVLGRMVSREPATLEVALPILCRMVIFYYDALVRTPPIRDVSYNQSTATSSSRCIPEASIAYHLPDFTQAQSLGELFSLINSVLLMPAHDIRMYPPSPTRRQPLVNGLPKDDASLLKYAQGRALKLKEWFCAKYEVLHKYQGQVVDVDGLFNLSLLHHANSLYRYKRYVESEFPTAAVLCTAEEIRSQLLQCLQPVHADIQQVLRRRGHSMPPEDKAIFLSDEERREIPNPLSPIPLSVIPTSRDMVHAVIIQSRD